MADRFNVAICLPMYGSIDPLVAVSQMQMAMTTVSFGISASTQMVRVPAVDVARNDLVERALEIGATHLMWLDSDVVPPADTVIQLLKHNRNAVSGLYHYKVPPYNPVAFEFGEGPEFGSHGFRHLPNIDSPGSLVRVGGVGLGCCLVKASIYRRFQDAFPGVPFHKMEYPVVGEDVWFFQHCVRLGISVWLDTSVQCLHVGSRAFGVGDWLVQVDEAKENGE